MADDPRQETPSAVGMSVLGRLTIIAAVAIAAVAVIVGVIVYVARS